MSAQAILYGGTAALQLAGGFFAAQNIKDTARLNRDIDEMNAEFAELDAHDAELDGYTQKAKYQGVVDNTLADQQLALTAADVDLSFGSASTIQRETKFIAELNNMEIEKQAQESSLGLKSQAREIRFAGDLKAGQAETQASSVLFQTAVGATRTGLTGYRRSR